MHVSPANMAMYNYQESVTIGQTDEQTDRHRTMRIKNNLEFQIGRYQSMATCFDIILIEALVEVWMSKHVAQD